MLKRFLRWLFLPPPLPGARAFTRVRLCPVDGCRTTLRNDHALCSLHAQLVPAPLQKAIYRARRDHGIASVAYRAAVATAAHAVERQLLRTPTRPQP